MPRQIALDFHAGKWTLKGMPGPGLYPIVPRARTWPLDSHRKKPLLGARRRQFIVSPGLARVPKWVWLTRRGRREEGAEEARRGERGDRLFKTRTQHHRM
eukprot:1841282-Pyramimonas_sp.AAC.1